MTITCRHIFSVLVLALYLFLPAQSLVHAVTFTTDQSGEQSDYAKSVQSSCPDCPCSDENDSGHCDTSFCSCSFHAPITAHLKNVYAPMVTIDHLPDPLWALPQMCGSIFVPPQNHS